MLVEYMMQWVDNKYTVGQTLFNDLRHLIYINVEKALEAGDNPIKSW